MVGRCAPLHGRRRAVYFCFFGQRRDAQRVLQQKTRRPEGVPLVLGSDQPEVARKNRRARSEKSRTPAGRRALSLSPTGSGFGISHKVFQRDRSEEHTSELQSHSFISYAVFCLKKTK